MNHSQVCDQGLVERHKVCKLSKDELNRPPVAALSPEILFVPVTLCKDFSFNH